MQLKFIILFLSALTLCQFSDAKYFNKCSLAKELVRLGVPKSELPDWVCIAEHESSYNTQAMNTNKNKTKDWGLFQINDRWWCDPQDGRKTANGCKVVCNDIRQDDITKAVRCAQQVKKEQGYTAWVAWTNKCQKSKPSVNECF